MLCSACQEIFSIPRKLSYGKYYSWKQDHISFQAALRNGCHLCHLIEDSLLSTSTSHHTVNFPQNVRFAFKALRSDWAQFGTGPKWFPIPSQAHGPLSPEELKHYQEELDSDPTPNNLSDHLESDSETLPQEMSKSWLVLEFYGPNTHCALPIDLAIGCEADVLAQKNIKKQFSTGCKGNLALARTWLNNCLTDHPSCRPRSTEAWLPTRLVDVGPCGNHIIRLVEGSTLHGNPSYIALSHRWGSGEHTVLKSTNLQSHQQNIPWGNLSATLQESVTVTRALGFRYLWVDTMCIIQDDPDDWSREASMMCKVYGLATCTIAGANSGEGDKGYFADRIPYRVRPCKVPSPFRVNSKYSYYVRSQYLQSIHEKHVRGSTWYNRGWVFQERTLSSRLLIFSGEQTLWACRKLQAAEMWPEGKTSKNHIDTFPSLEIEKARFKRLLDPSNTSVRNTMWFEFIRDYIASAKLTFDSDKLMAVHGLATLVQNMTDETYCGGLWLSDDLPDALMWTMQSELPFIPKERAAPSWSWATLSGIKAPNLRSSQDTEKLIKVVGHKILEATSNNRKSPPEALYVTGKLLPIVISIPHSTDRNACYRFFKHMLARTARQAAFDIIISLLLVSLVVLGIIYTYWCINRDDIAGTTGSILYLCLGVLLFYYFRSRIYPKIFRRKQPISIAQSYSSGFLPTVSHRTPLIGRFESKGDSNIAARFYCFMDYKIDAAGDFHVFCLPLISQESKHTHGIIIRTSTRHAGHYERIGTFSISKSRLEWSSESHRNETFWLV